MFITNEHVGDRSRLEDWRGMYWKSNKVKDRVICFCTRI